MKIDDIDKITTINIGASMFMYGYVGICIEKTDSGLCVSWIGVADGGDVIQDDEKDFVGKSLSELLNKISCLELDFSESQSANFEWELSFEENEEKINWEIESGYWDVNTFALIRDTIVDYLNDEKPFELLVDMIGY